MPDDDEYGKYTATAGVRAGKRCAEGSTAQEAPGGVRDPVREAAPLLDLSRPKPVSWGRLGTSVRGRPAQQDLGAKMVGPGRQRGVRARRIDAEALASTCAKAGPARFWGVEEVAPPSC